MDTNTITILSATVDELGALKAQIKRLENRETELKEILIAAGKECPVVNGNLFRSAVSFSNKVCVDRERLVELLVVQYGIDESTLHEFTELAKKSTPVTTVRLSSL